MSPIPVQEAGTYQVTTVMKPDSLPDSNSFQNVLFFQDIQTPERSFSDAADDIMAMMNQAWAGTNAPGTGPLIDYLSAVVNPALTEYKVYDLAEASPRIPEVRPATWAATGSTAIPNEVACVLSYRSGPAGASGGTNDPTRRGRLYFGPLSAAVFTHTAGDQDTRLFATPNARLRGFAAYLLTQPQDFGWVQYSRSVDRMAAVVGGFVDNTADTQRRRGAKATARTIWP